MPAGHQHQVHDEEGGPAHDEGGEHHAEHAAAPIRAQHRRSPPIRAHLAFSSDCVVLDILVRPRSALRPLCSISRAMLGGVCVPRLSSNLQHPHRKEFVKIKMLRRFISILYISIYIEINFLSLQYYFNPFCNIIKVQ